LSKQDDDDGSEGDGVEGENNVEQPFPFLDLPGELRNMIYDTSMEDDEALRRGRSRPVNPTYVRGGWSSRSYVEIVHHNARAEKLRTLFPTPEQKKHETRLRSLLTRVANRHLKVAETDGTLTTGCREAFERSKLEHEMYSHRCAHEVHEDENLIIPVNARGNLCDDLPMLSLVNRQIFHDTFFLFYSTRKDGLWLRWTIRNLDFFPFLRFCQDVTTGDWPAEIKLEEMHVDFDDEDEGKDRELHKRKYENVRRLMELHWLKGFPLWGCLTGLCDEKCCGGPFADWMYAVRQIVALYRVDYETWKWRSLKYLRRCEMMEDDDSSGGSFKTMTDADLVEATIDMLCTAIKYNLGRIGRGMS
jgi:hypothetical protein